LRESDKEAGPGKQKEVEDKDVNDLNIKPSDATDL